MEELHDWPCQDLHGGGGSAIYDNIDGRCKHPECHPRNKCSGCQYEDTTDGTTCYMFEDITICKAKR